MNKTLLIIAATLLLTLSNFAQRPDFSKFEVIGFNEDTETAYMVTKDREKDGPKIKFSLIVIHAKEDDKGLGIDGDNFWLGDIEANCDTKQFQVTRLQTTRDGKTTITKEASEKITAPPLSRMGKVLGTICQEKLGLEAKF